MDEYDRGLGSLLGLAVGDAVGTTVEGMPSGSFQEVTDMVGGGKFSLLPGQVGYWHGFELFVRFTISGQMTPVWHCAWLRA